MNVPKLRKQLRLGIDEIEDVLQRLSTASWVRKAAGEGWVLVRDPEQLMVADVYRLFVFDPERAHPKTPHSGIPDSLLQDTLNKGEMKIPLKTLFTEGGNGAQPATI